MENDGRSPPAPAEHSTAPSRFFRIALLAATAALCLHTAIWKSPPAYGVFLEAAGDTLTGDNPYSREPGLDFFKYSPLAALLMTPFLYVPEPLGLFLLLFSQCLLFYWGFLRWSRAAGYDPWASRRLFLVALISVGFDLTLSVQNAQVNPGIFALMLLGAARAAESKPARAGLLLSLATNLKIFPFTLGLCLLTRFERRFWTTYLGGLLFWLALPALALGTSRSLELHRQWLALMSWDAGRDVPMLDLGTFLHIHFGTDPSVRTPLALIAGAAIGWAAFVLFRRGEDGLVHRFLLPVNGLYVVLFSYLSESPTSILATAGMFLIGARALESRGRGEALLYGIVWAVALALSGVAYSDLVPPAYRTWVRTLHLKTVGYLVILTANAAIALRLWTRRARGATESAATLEEETLISSGLSSMHRPESDTERTSPHAQNGSLHGP